MARAWNSPSRPVMPWTTRRVSRPTRMLTRPPLARRRDGLRGGLVERGCGLEVRRLEQLGGLRGVRAHDPDDHRHVARLLLAGLDQAQGDLVAAGDAAEDVHEDRLDLRLGEDQPHRRRDALGLRPAADVEEVGRLAAGALHEVHRRHRQAGAVDHAADRAVEMDEADVVAARLGVRRAPPRRGRAAPRGPGCRKSAESSSVILASRQTSCSSAPPGPPRGRPRAG